MVVAETEKCAGAPGTAPITVWNRRSPDGGPSICASRQARPGSAARLLSSSSKGARDGGGQAAELDDAGRPRRPSIGVATNLPEAIITARAARCSAPTVDVVAALAFERCVQAEFRRQGLRPHAGGDDHGGKAAMVSPPARTPVTLPPSRTMSVTSALTIRAPSASAWAARSFTYWPGSVMCPWPASRAAKPSLRESRVIGAECVALQFVPPETVVAADRPAERVAFEMSAVAIREKIVGRHDPFFRAGALRQRLVIGEAVADQRRQCAAMRRTSAAAMPQVARQPGDEPRQVSPFQE